MRKYLDPNEIDSDIPGVRVFMVDGVVSCSIHGTWLSALFTSVEAMKSWSGNWDEAEESFKKQIGPQPLSNRIT